MVGNERRAAVIRSGWN